MALGNLNSVSINILTRIYVYILRQGFALIASVKGEGSCTLQHRIWGKTTSKTMLPKCGSATEAAKRKHQERNVRGGKKRLKVALKRATPAKTFPKNGDRLKHMRRPTDLL